MHHRWDAPGHKLEQRHTPAAHKRMQKRQKGKKKHATPPTSHTFVCSECIARSFLPWTSLAP